MKANKTCLCGKCKAQYTSEIEIDKKTWEKIEEMRGKMCREKFIDKIIKEYIEENQD